MLLTGSGDSGREDSRDRSEPSSAPDNAMQEDWFSTNMLMRFDCIPIANGSEGGGGGHAQWQCVDSEVAGKGRKGTAIVQLM